MSGCTSESSPVASVEIPPSGPITIAFTGDTSFTSLDGVSSNAFDVVRNATLGFTNLEVNLLDAAASRDAAARPAPRWIFAHDADARRLRDLGFDLVSLANNHAIDFGADGLRSTLAALDAAGVRHGGAGPDLVSARAATFAGNDSRRVAFIAVTASASDQARASASQQDIRGRPGVSPLVFDAAITVDAETYRTLAQSVQALGAGPPPGEREMTMFGRRIAKGEQTRVEFALKAIEEQGVLNVIRDARQQSEIVVLSIHSHEPVNGSDEPATFVRQFAHDAIDAGAQVVVGHGPHRIRGIEIYKGAPIFYSLGNFLYQTNGLDFRAADPFDAGSNLYTAALGAASQAASPFGQLDQEWWWQGLLAVASAGGGRVIDVKIYPVTLQAANQAGQKGLPQLASGAEAETILRQISAVSRALGTDLDDPSSRPFLDVPIPENR